MSAIDNINFKFLYIDLYSMGSTWVYKESVIPYNIFRYIVKGKAEFNIDDEKILVEENQIIYIPNGCKMSCRAVTDTFEFFSIRFVTSVFYAGEDILKEYYNIQRVTQNKCESRYFEEIYKWVKSDNSVKKCFVRGYLDILIGQLSIRGSDRVNSTQKQICLENKPVKISEKVNNKERQIDNRIRNVADYIVLNPKEKYTPEKMADMAGLSKQRFSSLFKENMGKAPMQYVKEIRLTTAARNLLVSDDNINDIAYEVGYGDTNYFIREFKKAFGFTPNKYRKVACG